MKISIFAVIFAAAMASAKPSRGSYECCNGNASDCINGTECFSDYDCRYYPEHTTCHEAEFFPPTNGGHRGGGGGRGGRGGGGGRGGHGADSIDSSDAE
ncbi:hypothetical protein E4U55_000443 [Claviceps digitariae]|nr:hypothetical protein E4U55_000443 [Claviceps digitariae]